MYIQSKDYIVKWNLAKNTILKESRGIGFEDVIDAIELGNLVGITPHPNKLKYPRQHMIYITFHNYVYAIPVVFTENTAFLKTIFPSRKATKQQKMKGLI